MKRLAILLTFSFSLLITTLAVAVRRGDVQSGDQLDKSSRLFAAIRRRYVSDVKELIKSGEDLEQLSPSGFRPLHYALANLDVEMVRLLLLAGADPKAVLSRSVYAANTPLTGKRGDSYIGWMVRTGLVISGYQPRAHAEAECVRLLVIAGERPTAQETHDFGRVIGDSPELRNLAKVLSRLAEDDKGSRDSATGSR